MTTTPPLLVCRPDGPHCYPASLPAVCARCGAAVRVAPAQQMYFGLAIVSCPACAAPVAAAKKKATR